MYKRPCPDCGATITIPIRAHTARIHGATIHIPIHADTTTINRHIAISEAPHPKLTTNT